MLHRMARKIPEKAEGTDASQSEKFCISKLKCQKCRTEFCKSTKNTTKCRTWRFLSVFQKAVPCIKNSIAARLLKKIMGLSHSRLFTPTVRQPLFASTKMSLHILLQALFSVAYGTFVIVWVRSVILLNLLLPSRHLPTLRQANLR